MSNTNPSPHRNNHPAMGRRAKRRGLGFSIGLMVLLVGLLGAAILLAMQALTLFAPADPVLVTAAEALLTRREQAAAQLAEYAWVDKEAGIVRIPIAQAMAVIAEQGLPVNDPQQALAQADTPATATSTAEPVLQQATATATIEPVVIDAEPTATSEPINPSEATPTDTPETATEAVVDPSPTPEPEAAPTAEPAPEAAPVDLSNVSFQASILPIFEEHCTECHGGDAPDEGLSLESYAGLLAGSDFGPVIEPGNPNDSYLVEQVIEGRMPRRRDPLSPTEIEIIIAWVEAGALDN